MKKKWIIIVIAALLAIAAFAVVLIVNQNNTPPEDTDTISIADDCWDHVTDMNIVERDDGSAEVTLTAPDYVALIKILVAEDYDTITRELIAQAVKSNPKTVKEYTFVAPSTSDVDVKTALMEIVSYELVALTLEDVKG